jgi:hypothetical protein
MVVRTSNTGQKAGCATTSYAIQRILLFPLVCDDGFGSGECCTHGSCQRRRNHHRFVTLDFSQTRSLERTKETDGPARPRKESGRAFGVGPERVLHAADEGTDQGSLQSDGCSILKRWPRFKTWRIR